MSLNYFCIHFITSWCLNHTNHFCNRVYICFLNVALFYTCIICICWFYIYCSKLISPNFLNLTNIIKLHNHKLVSCYTISINRASFIYFKSGILVNNNICSAFCVSTHYSIAFCCNKFTVIIYSKSTIFCIADTPWSIYCKESIILLNSKIKFIACFFNMSHLKVCRVFMKKNSCIYSFIIMRFSYKILWVSFIFWSVYGKNCPVSFITISIHIC